MSDMYGFIRNIAQKKFSRGNDATRRIFIFGCGGSCTALAELIMFGLRGIKNCEMFYVPNLKMDRAHKMRYNPELGVQLEEHPYDGSKADVIILMGGLTIPKYGLDVNEVRDLIDRISNNDTMIIGACANSVFQKSGWTEKIDFDYIVDITMNVFLKKVESAKFASGE